MNQGSRSPIDTAISKTWVKCHLWLLNSDYQLVHRSVLQSLHSRISTISHFDTHSSQSPKPRSVAPQTEQEPRWPPGWSVGKHTSSISVAEVGEPPDIAQAHGVAYTGEDELDLVPPVAPS